MADNNLPTAPASINRSERGWGYRRKLSLCRKLAGGEIGFVEACDQFGLGPEELRQWQRNYAARGAQGLLMPPRLTREGKPGRRSRRAKQEAIAAVLVALIGETQ